MMTSPAVVRSSKWKAVASGLLAFLIALIVWEGADRRASDATKPLAQGTSSRELFSPPPTLKIGSFNIHGGKGTDGVRDLARIAELLTGEDVVGLYEVRAKWGELHPNQAATLGNLRDTGWLFAPAEQQWWTDHFGNGLINRIPVKSVLRIPLINTRGKAFRNAILSTVSLQATDVHILSVHIDREADRRRHLQAVIGLFLSLQEPCVLMGDLNSTADDPLISELRQHPGVHSPLHESLGKAPHRQTIDWIFTRGLATVSAALVDNSSSDHPYLKAELAPFDSSSPAANEEPQ
jgi:endonuclease/exonuclease/phosphatase family metal-dependent hydrolase